MLFFLVVFVPLLSGTVVLQNFRNTVIIAQENLEDRIYQNTNLSKQQ